MSVPRRSTTALPNGRRELYQGLVRACRPRPLTTVSGWADAHRVLSSKGSGEPGPWRTSRTPYLREIMDQLSVSSPVQRIVLMFAAQIGKTESASTGSATSCTTPPRPMLVVLPDAGGAQALGEAAPGSAADGNAGAALHLRRQALARFGQRRGHEGLPRRHARGRRREQRGVSLASMPIRYVICDEVDRFPWEVGQEGDPLGLIDERTKTFPGARCCWSPRPR
jgi:phage terminase large subunit GpA-like protein